MKKKKSQPNREIRNTWENLIEFFVLLKGKYFLLRLQSTGFSPVLDFTFSFLLSLQFKLYRGTSILFHLGECECTPNSSAQVDA